MNKQKLKDFIKQNASQIKERIQIGETFYTNKFNLDNIKLIHNKGYNKIYQSTNYIIKERYVNFSILNINDTYSIINEITHHNKLSNEKQIVTLYETSYYYNYENNNIYIYLILEKLDNIQNYNINNSLIKQLLYAIKTIHKNNIVHCDLNKHNIFIDKKKYILKIGDFDCSTMNNHIIGCNQLYISPEYNKVINSTYNTHSTITTKHDIYSLGILLLEFKYKINIYKLYNNNFDLYYNNICQSINNNNILRLLNRNYYDRPDIQEIIDEQYFTYNFCCI